MSSVETAPSQAPPKFREENLGRWCANRQASEVEYQLVRALNGGTKAMREMGATLLPPDQRERDIPLDWTARRDRTVLFPGYHEAVDQIASRPFQKAVQIKDGELLPTPLQKLEEDVDRNGADLTAFARWLLGAVVDRGIGLYLVDSPPPAAIPDGRGGTRPANAADDDNLDLRPYFVRIPADSLIDWAWTTDEAQRVVLAYIQVYDEIHRTNPVSGDQTIIQQIRYWSRTEWQVWERNFTPPTGGTGNSITAPDLTTRAKDAWQRSLNDVATGGAKYFMVRQGKHPLGEVPLVAVNVNQFGTDRLTARPPLIDLAWLNVAHWQSTSQQINILHCGRAPILAGSGVEPDIADGTRKVILGAGAGIYSRNPDFKLIYVEPEGKAIAAGAEDLKALEDKMTRLGMQPLMLPVTSPQTATGVAADELRSQAKAQSWVEATEAGLYRGYELAAKWIGAELPETFTIALFRDIGILARSQQDLDTLNKARDRGDLARRPYLKAIQERGVLSADFDAEENDSMLEQEQTQQQEVWMDQAEAAAKFKAASAPPTGAKKPPAQNPAMGAA